MRRGEECGRRWRKHAYAITDRAARYRATHPDCRPPGRRLCAFCGSTRNVEVHHVDGDESNTESENLLWACRSCNVKVAIVLQSAGIGRLTRQFNPKAEGAHSLGQWITAVQGMRGESNMDPASAISMIHATPAQRRSEFALEIWRRRRQRYGMRGRG